jgi:hypothetical protein
MTDLNNGVGVVFFVRCEQNFKSNFDEMQSSVF